MKRSRCAADSRGSANNTCGPINTTATVYPPFWTDQVQETKTFLRFHGRPGRTEVSTIACVNDLDSISCVRGK